MPMRRTRPPRLRKSRTKRHSGFWRWGLLQLMVILQINPLQVRWPIHLLNTLFSTVNPSDKELAQLGMPNAQSALLLALMASENWKRAAELLEVSVKANLLD